MLKKLIDRLNNQNREVIQYVIFGGLISAVSIGIYWLFNDPLGVNELIANIVSWILAVTFAYVTNRKWVFNSNAMGVYGITKEMASFYLGRLATLAIEELIIFIFITLLEFNSLLVKIASQVVVIVGNYMISKLIVFK